MKNMRQSIPIGLDGERIAPIGAGGDRVTPIGSGGENNAPISSVSLSNPPRSPRFPSPLPPLPPSPIPLSTRQSPSDLGRTVVRVDLGESLEGRHGRTGALGVGVVDHDVSERFRGIKAFVPGIGKRGVTIVPRMAVVDRIIDGGGGGTHLLLVFAV